MNFLSKACFLVLCALLVTPLFAQDTRTAETQALLQWLTSNTQRPALGAQWNGGVKSIGWDDQASISGKMPLVFGIEYYDYGPIEKNLPARETGAKFVAEKYAQGGIITLVDHMPNFVTGGDSWDRGGAALDAVMPGGTSHAAFVAYLDRLASFLNGLSVKGQPVPVLLRPLHEMNGAWFWWGDAKSGERVAKLWRFYHDYLVNEKGVKNVLWVWSPNIEKAAAVDRLMAYWPGAGYVDLVGLDGYDNTAVPNITNPSFVDSFNAVFGIAKRFGLPLALTEIGAKPGAQEVTDFWVKQVMRALQKEFSGTSYVLVWNGGWGPKAGTPAADGFRRLTQSGQVLQLGDVPAVQIYGVGFPH